MRLFVLLFLILQFAIEICAHPFDSGNSLVESYYMLAGEELSPDSHIVIILSNDDHLASWHFFPLLTCKNASEVLNKNQDYYKNALRKRYPDQLFEYDANLSNTKNKVYRRINYGTWIPGVGSSIEGCSYYAISRDGSTLIFWRENTSGEISGKTYFYRIEKESLIFDTYDFLN